jgi:hypothetical protein
MIDWNALPPEFKWAAMDSDGSWFAYTEEPVVDPGTATWRLRSGEEITDKNCLDIPSPMDWEATLTRKSSPEALENVFKL